jgi:ferrochelatase
MATGVLLVQLGSPDAPTPKAVRAFLAEFLGDRRVVDLNPVLWWTILHGIILRVRPKRSAALYRRVWTEEGSPIILHTHAQGAALAARLGDDYRVAVGMRYGSPPLAAAADELMEAGCGRIVVLPLFPQYSCATSASVFDALATWARARRELPSLTFVRGFADHPAWIRALAETTRETGIRPTPESPLLISFHGIPQRYATEGDPYPRECGATAVGLAEALGLTPGAWRVVFQSRFGREPWLQPYLDETLAALPGEGIRSVSVTTPSFVSDCLETIDEVGREAEHTFCEAGGETYVRVPCPNARPELIDALEAIVREA